MTTYKFNQLIIGTVITGLMTACGGDKVAQQVEKEPTKGALLLLDVSASTPLTDPKLASYVLSSFREEVAQLHVGSMAIAYSVGDDAVAPLTYKKRIQMRMSDDGDKADVIADDLVQQVNGLVSSLKKGTVDKQQNSQLFGAIYDASKYCSKFAECSVTFVTDGVDTDLINGGMPQAQGLRLSNMDIKMVGVGRGLNSKQRIALEAAWMKELKKYKPHSVTLERVG